jgi:hypothetical protein
MIGKQRRWLAGGKSPLDRSVSKTGRLPLSGMSESCRLCPWDRAHGAEPSWQPAAGAGGVGLSGATSGRGDHRGAGGDARGVARAERAQLDAAVRGLVSNRRGSSGTVEEPGGRVGRARTARKNSKLHLTPRVKQRGNDLRNKQRRRVIHRQIDCCMQQSSRTPLRGAWFLTK